VLVPAVFVAAVVAVANRHDVTFRLDPFSSDNPAIAFSMPLFLLVFLTFLGGVLLGGATVALRRRPRSPRPAPSRVPALIEPSRNPMDGAES